MLRRPSRALVAPLVRLVEEVWVDVRMQMAGGVQRGQVPMAAVAEDGHDGVPRPEPPGRLDRGAAVHRGRGTDKETVAVEQGLRHADALRILHAYGVVNLGGRKVGGDAVTADALDDGVVPMATLRALLLLRGVEHAILDTVVCRLRVKHMQDAQVGCEGGGVVPGCTTW